MPASTSKSPPRSARLGSVLLLALTGSTLLTTIGCTAVGYGPSQVDRLLTHPEFRTAAQAAPAFTAAALKTVADLEARRR